MWIDCLILHQNSSYSLLLWHWSLFDFDRYDTPLYLIGKLYPVIWTDSYWFLYWLYQEFYICIIVWVNFTESCTNSCMIHVCGVISVMPILCQFGNLWYSVRQWHNIWPDRELMNQPDTGCTNAFWIMADRNDTEWFYQSLSYTMTDSVCWLCTEILWFG